MMRRARLSGFTLVNFNSELAHADNNLNQHSNARADTDDAIPCNYDTEEATYGVQTRVMSSESCP